MTQPSLQKAFEELLKALKLPLPEENNTPTNSSDTPQDPIELFKLVLDSFKLTLKDLHNIHKKSCQEQGLDPSEVIENPKHIKNPKVKEALDNFSKELKRWDKDMISKLSKHPQLALMFANAGIDKVDKKPIKKKKRSKKKDNWLSA